MLHSVTCKRKLKVVVEVEKKKNNETKGTKEIKFEDGIVFF